MHTSSYMVQTLIKLLEGKSLSHVSTAKNSNQYFANIKKQGIELVEISKKNTSNKGSHLERSLAQNIDNIQRAKGYLNQLQYKQDKIA